MNSPLKQLNFFHSQPSTLPKVNLSTTFGLSFMIRSVAPTRSSTFCEYLITKIRNRNLESHYMEFLALGIFFQSNRKNFSIIIIVKQSSKGPNYNYTGSCFLGAWIRLDLDFLELGIFFHSNRKF